MRTRRPRAPPIAFLAFARARAQLDKVDLKRRTIFTPDNQMEYYAIAKSLFEVKQLLNTFGIPFTVQELAA